MAKKKETQTAEVVVSADVVTTEPPAENAVVLSSFSFALEAYGVIDGVVPGAEAIESDDVSIPRLKVIQALSKEAQRDTDPVVLGSLFNNGTDEVLAKPKKKMKVIPLMLLKPRLMFNKDRKLVYRSDDSKTHSETSPAGAREDGITVCADCPDSRWTRVGEENYRGEGEKDDPPRCPIFYTWPVLILNDDATELLEPGPLMMALAKTGVPTAKKINGLSKWSGLPYYSFILDIWTEKDDRGSGPFATLLAARSARMKPDDPRFKYAEHVFQSLENANVTTDFGDAEDLM